MFISFTSIAVGSHWSRNELAKLWGYKAYQALARGVVTPAGDNKIILFVTEQKQVSATNYQDVLHGDVLEWEGPNDHFAEDRILTAKDTGQEIHLFHRPRHHMDFTYQGKLSVRSMTQLTKTPSKFVFQLLNLENAVSRSSEQRKANTGAAFKPIPGAAPQFQTGGLALSGMLNCDNALVKFHAVNCGI